MVLVVPNAFPEPKLSTNPLIHPKIGCYITPGEFFLCRLGDVLGNAPEKLTVCRILSCDSSSSSLEVNIFERSSLYYFDCLDADPVIDTSICNYEEVYQSTSRQVISLESVVYPAFVLTEKRLQDRTKYPSLVGMSSIFLLRYRTNGDTIPFGACLSFPSDYESCPLITCFTKTAFEEILRLRFSIQKSISRIGLRQGFFCRQYGTCELSAHTWAYVLLFLEGVIAPPIKNHWKGLKKYVDLGLNILLLTDIDDRPIYRFETTQELTILTKLIGKLGLVALRKKVKRGIELTLKPNNVLNVIPPYNSRLDFDKRTTTRHGLDLKWSAKEQRLYLASRYARYIYRPVCRKTDQRPDPSHSQKFHGRSEINLPELTSFLSCLIMNEDLSSHVEEPLAENGITLREGMYFDYQSEQYVIRHMDEAAGTAQCQITWTECISRERNIFEFKIDSVLNFCQAKLLD
jgi:hypothetical protein